MEILLDVNRTQSPRMFFLHNDESREFKEFKLQRGAGLSCIRLKAYVTPLKVGENLRKSSGSHNFFPF